MFWYVQKLGPSACFRSYRRRLDKWWHTDITICLPLLSKDKSNLKKMREISDKIFWHSFSCKYCEPFSSKCQICFSFSLPHRGAKRFQKVRKKRGSQKMVSSGSSNKTDNTVDMKCCARKQCQNLCTFLFGATCAFGKKWLYQQPTNKDVKSCSKSF